ncbi:hypothetical protein MSG28_008203 [Choristoneura fumiferana]|uniref:Uncharacterized protein n=1 Tax=Choristoneura fumiferana TaxID=7141 RepID=A0ACC0JAP5_CHOFU|nr:hypothetical protein MSG28_008203 [Choristoneura fumiferana]
MSNFCVIKNSVLEYGNNTYYCKRRDRPRIQWYCRNRMKGCPAFIITYNNNIINIEDDHNHFLEQLSEYFIQLSSGRHLLCYGGHTFSSNSKNLEGSSTWYCSRRKSRSCRASIKVYGRNVYSYSGNHSH